MGKLRLSIKSTDVLGVYGIVDLVFNGATIESNKQLTADPVALEYDVDILTAADNSLKVNLLNDQAHDANQDGDFLDAEDQVLTASLTALSYSTDGANFTTLLPQIATSFTVPDGVYAGNVITLTESVTSFGSYGVDYAITFNSDGIVETEYCSGLKGKILPNGNYVDLINGKTYDSDGNEV
jgi:hypothetical protein